MEKSTLVGSGHGFSAASVGGFCFYFGTISILSLDYQALYSWLITVGAAFCLFWHLWWIIPYTPLGQVEVKSPTSDQLSSISILTANVLMTNRKTSSFFKQINDYQPDLVVRLESDQWWQDQLDCALSDYPYTIKCPLDNLYGIHVYSRLELKDSQITYLVERDILSIHTLVMLAAGVSVRIHCLHPAPPSVLENETSIERDVELVVVARSVEESDAPVIVTGDLNDVAWSRTTRLFRKISGLLDPRMGRGFFNTFHADYPFFRWPLDHVFHSSHFSLQSLERLDPIGSDHFPLFVRLHFDLSNQTEVDALEKNADDDAFADDIAKQKKVGPEDVPRPGE